MKRSEINSCIKEATVIIEGAGIGLPGHASWGPEDWQQNREAAVEMLRRGIGWNISDFGGGDYLKMGIVFYTVSNGVFDPATGMPVDQIYAHRYFILKEGQQIMTEHHHTKIEDIIVFAGAQLRVELHNVGPNEELDKTNDINIMRSGIWNSYKPGTVITLSRGERIRFEPIHYHRPWGHGGTVLIEEVCMVTDDLKESRHLPAEKPMVFATIEEDEKPAYLLCSELPGSSKFEEMVRQYIN